MTDKTPVKGDLRFEVTPVYRKTIFGNNGHFRYDRKLQIYNGVDWDYPKEYWRESISI